MRSHRVKGELLIPLLQVATDLAVVEISFLLSYWLRFYSPLTTMVPVLKGFPPFGVYLISSWFVMVVWVVIFRTLHMYGARRNASRVDELYRVVEGVSLGMLVVLSGTFFYRGFSYSRLVFVLIWATSIVLLGVSRVALIHYERHLHGRGRRLLNAAIVGSGKWGEHLFRNVDRRPGLGFQFVGHVGGNAFLRERLPSLGEFEDLARIAGGGQVWTFFLAPDDAELSKLSPLLNECSGLNVDFYLVPNLLEIMTSRVRVEDLEGIPVLKIKDVAMTGWSHIFKRAFDVGLSSIALLLLWPVFFVISLAILVDSRGTVFYRQERVGMDGREFRLLKFRTMSMDAERKTGPVWAVKGDTRVTGVGRVLRKTSLDETPQLWNVLRGDMSLVGPRPERQYFVEQFRASIPKYLERHRVKSGMTGWAQVHGLRGNAPIEERTRYDLYYVENWSLMLDIRVLLMTVWAVLKGENSY
jgi:exopolysaccharide biosynthesis polyprenyl glycosylphosphotransferase